MTSTFTPPAPLQTAVLFLVFNRPDTTAQVFEAIRQAKPPRLYVAADGPREGREGEADRVAKVREIATAVDWPCEVKTLFREKNLGCKYAVSGAITWFFEQEEQGIILEDDCLPSQSFFWFCEELLNRYKDDERIFIISGYNKQQQWGSKSNSYFFSSLGGIWGWASWRRAWKNYDIEMQGLEYLVREGFFEQNLGKLVGQIRQEQLVNAKNKMLRGEIDTWDYQWGFSRHKHRALACVPRVSLIANIGFGQDATHTASKSGDAVLQKELLPPYFENSNMSPDLSYDARFLGIYPGWRLTRSLKKWKSR